MIDNIVFVRELNYRLKYQPNKKTIPSIKLSRCSMGKRIDKFVFQAMEHI